MTGAICLEDFLKINYPVNLKLSAAHPYGLYSLETFDYDNNGYEKKLMLLDTLKNRSREVGLPFVPDEYEFDENGVIYMAIRGDQTVFYWDSFPLGNPQQLMELPFKVIKFGFYKEHCYFTARVQLPSNGGTPYCSTKNPFYQEGVGVVGDGLVGLFKAQIKGRDIRLISGLELDIEAVDFDFDHSRILYSAYTKSQVKPVASRLYSYDILGEKFSDLKDGNFRIGLIKSISRHESVFTGVDLDHYSRNDAQQLYRVDHQRGTCELLGPWVDFSNEHPSVVSDSAFSGPPGLLFHEGKLYLKRVHKNRDVLYVTDLSGETEVLETGLTAIHGFALNSRGLFLIGLKELSLLEIYQVSPGKSLPVTDHNRWLKDKVLSRPKPLTFEYRNETYEGWVYSPNPMVKGHRYPGILLIHGGPKMIYSDVYSHEVQLLAREGFFVFYMNPRGSDGRGNEFANIRGHFADEPYDELMAFTDEVLRAYPEMDDNLLGVTGGSYGGYLVNYIIGRTDRFKAAVTERGISNLMTSINLTDIGYQYMMEYMDGRLPWEHPGLYMENSPVYKAHQVKTPTLFIHGKSDYRCHYTEALNMHSALVFNGVPTKLCLFEKEGHSLVVRGRPVSKKHRYQEMLAWFNQYLKRGVR